MTSAYRQNAYTPPSPPRRRVRWFAIAAMTCVVLGVTTAAAATFAVPTVVSNCGGPHDRSQTERRALVAVAEAWRANHPNECPTIQRLQYEHELSPSFPIHDAWGHAYAVSCTDDAVVVSGDSP